MSEARDDARTVSSTLSPAPLSLLMAHHSASEVAQRHSHRHSRNDHLGPGAARSRPIRPRIAANNSRGMRDRHLGHLERNGPGLTDELGLDVE